MGADVATNGFRSDTQGSVDNFAKITVIPVNSLPASNFAATQLVLLTTDGRIYRNDGSYATPSWTAISLGPLAPTLTRVEKSGDTTTTSTTFTDLTGMTHTLGNSGKKFTAICVLVVRNSASDHVRARWVDNATNKNPVEVTTPTSGHSCILVLCLNGTCSGQTIKIQWNVGSGTGTVYGSSDGFSFIEVTEYTQ